MRTALPLLALTALLALPALPPTLPAAGQAVQPITAATPPLANVPVHLAVQGVPEALGPSLVQNGGFDSGMAPWQRATGNLGPRAVASADQGVLLLKATNTNAGAVLAFQQMQHPTGSHYLLRLRLSMDGPDPSKVTLLLRETLGNGTNLDTRFTVAPAVGSGWLTYNLTWTPRSATARILTLSVLMTVDQGRDQQVRVDDVALLPVPAVAWSVPGGTVLDAGVLQATVLFFAKGAQSVDATATDAGAVLWRAHADFTLANAPPRAALAPFGDLQLNLPTVLDATASVDPDAPLALQDPGFADLGNTWRPGGANVTATALAGGAGVQLQARPATAGGFAYLQQTVPLPPGNATAVLATRVQDDGNTLYTLLLRESNATANRDTSKSFPPAGDRGRLLTLPWRRALADSTTLTVYLRFRANASGEATARFLAPRLLAGLTFTWRLDGAPLPGPPGAPAPAGPTAVLTPRSPGRHTLTLTVTDLDGASDALAVAFNATDAGFVWGRPPPAVAPLVPPTDLGLGTIGRAEGDEGQLANGGFAAGTSPWRLGDATGGTTWSVLVDDGVPYAHLVANASKARPVSLQQDAGRLCTLVACTLSFEYRGSVPLDAILRAANATADGSGPVDTHVAAAPSEEWTLVEAPWNVSANAGRLTVFLRAPIAARQAAWLDFRDVALEPALTLTPSVEGPGAPSLGNGTVAFTTAGPHHIHVAVGNPYGQVGGVDADVEVLPVVFFPTPSGRLGLRLDGASPGSVTVLAPDGTPRQALDLAAPAGADAILSNGLRFHRLNATAGDRVVLAAGGASATYARADLLPQDAPPPPSVDVATQGWVTVVRVTLAAPDLAVFNGTVRALRNGTVAAQAALERRGDSLVAEVRLPLAFTAGNYTLDYAVRDAWGDALPLATQEVGVPANGLLIGGIALLAATALVLGLGLAHRAWLRRGRGGAA